MFDGFRCLIYLQALVTVMVLFEVSRATPPVGWSGGKCYIRGAKTYQR